MDTTRRILVVDDSPTSLAIVREVLQSAGYEVLTASDGLSAINTALRQVPDLIITDVEMPEMSGLHLCYLVKGDPRTQHIPVLILSVHGEQYEQFRGLTTGADDYLPKPFRPEDLRARVKALLDSQEVSKTSPRPTAEVAETSPTEALQRINAALERRLFDLTAVQGISELAATVRGERETVSALLERLSRLIDFAAGGVLLANGNSYLRVRRSIHPSILDHLQTALQNALPLPEGASQLPILVGGGEFIAHSAASELPELLVLPLRISTRAVGVLGVAREKRRPFNREEQYLLGLISDHAALVLDHARLEEAERAHAEALEKQAEALRMMNERLAQLSITDGLTGLYNRRHLDERLREEVARAKRYRQRLALLMVDIDHFKQVNDQFGHQQGDRVLQAVADVLRHTARTSDIIGRYGGEEFCVIAPGADAAAGVVLAERIRTNISERTFVLGTQTKRITVSVGVAEYREGMTPEELIAEADRALFLAKNGGRNRVCTAPHSVEVPRQHEPG